MTNKVKTPPEDRIYDDDDGFLLRAASVCVKNKNESEVLLVSSHSKPGRWIIPGGKIQANEDPGTSAAREAMEEAGARGRLGRSLGKFTDPDRRHRTTVFVLHVDPENGGLVGDFEEKDHRLRKWFQIEEAKFILAKPLHAQYLNALEKSSSQLNIPNNISPTTPDQLIDSATTKFQNRIGSNDSTSKADRYYTFPSNEDNIHLVLNVDSDSHTLSSQSKCNIGVHPSSTLEHININGSCKSQLSTKEDLDSTATSQVNAGVNILKNI